jgi:hypothetical protein
MVNEGMVNFEALKNYLKENLILEKHISFKNLTPEKYNTYWSPWLPIVCHFKNPSVQFMP